MKPNPVKESKKYILSNTTIFRNNKKHNLFSKKRKKHSLDSRGGLWRRSGRKKTREENSEKPRGNGEEKRTGNLRNKNRHVRR